jgi:hypothetical protein
MFISLLLNLLETLSAVLALGLAGFVFSRNQRAGVNRWLALGFIAIGVYQALLLSYGLAEPASSRLLLMRLTLAASAVMPPIWLAFSLTFGKGNGRSHVIHWQPVLLVMAAASLLAWITLALGRVIHPLQFETAGVIVIGVDLWGKIFFTVYLVCLVVVLFHMQNLYRHADRLNRWKIKFLVVGIFVAFACQIVGVSYALLFGMIHPLYPLYSTFGFLLGAGMIAFSLVRHRLLDVDIFVSRYMVYRSLTLALVGGYLISLGMLAELFRWLNIPLDLLTWTFLAIIGALALSLLLLSEDIRRRLKESIHIHFYKHKYDYRMEWMEFTRRLSRATAIPEIAAQTVNRVIEVMWIRQAAMYTLRGRPGQMTLAHQVQYDCLPTKLELDSTLVKAFLEHAKFIASAAENGKQLDNIGQLSRRLFEGIPVGLLVPIATLDNLVGLLVVGLELSGKAFGVDDRDLLTAVVAQAGALILNAQLSQEAFEGRQLQLFARMSAFFAHDLKNAISMLTMLVDNARVHIHNPYFQQDALHALGSLTTRMRRMLGLLSTTDSSDRTEWRPICLSSCIDTWLNEIRRQVPAHIRLESVLDRTPLVMGDPEKLRALLDNLILNAIEAISGKGTIQIETRADNRHAVLSVSDTGCGMSEEFIRHRLFRPFHTTKSGGLGIGLYQCRHLVESLGGELVAESQEGTGTRMIIRIPTAGVSSDLTPVSH